MRLFDRIRHRGEVKELPCPRCGIPAPEHIVECAACGWDLRETYDGVVAGSTLKESEAASRT
jgi:hypothetical protein